MHLLCRIRGVRIYVSSTFEDLKDYRTAVAQAFRRSGHEVVAMEEYVASDQRPLDKCLADVRSCDIYVCLVAWRYGYVPPDNHGGEVGRSITELEYRAALAIGIPVLAFLADPSTPWPPVDTDAYTGEDDAGGLVLAFRDELATEHVVSSFSSPSQLASVAAPALYQLEGELGLRTKVGEAPTQTETKPTTDLRSTMIELHRHLGDTRLAFVGQAQQRDALRSAMERRLAPDDEPPLQHERFFAKYDDQLTGDERFQFERIRSITQGPMHDGNSRMLELLNGNPEVLQAIPQFEQLRQHLAFWMNKYDHLFVHTPSMCVLYVGVEDRTPFPSEIDGLVEAWSKRVERGDESS